MMDDIVRPAVETSPNCPVCSSGVGKAHTVSLRKGQQTIHYRCLACGHMWVTTGPTLPDVISPRPKPADCLKV